MWGLINKLMALPLLFGGGYLLMRYGMFYDHQTSLYVAFIAMPLAVFAVWLRSYKGKRFK